MASLAGLSPRMRPLPTGLGQVRRHRRDQRTTPSEAQKPLGEVGLLVGVGQDPVDPAQQSADE